MKKLVVGKTGWWSGLFPGFRQPIELVFKEIERLEPDQEIITRQDTWHDHGLKQPTQAANWIARQYDPGDVVVLLGHSYGASACTHDLFWLRALKIPVRLFISEDQGLDSLFIKDKRIGKGVETVMEYRVAYEALSFDSSFDGEHISRKVGRGFWNHTRTFVEPDLVREVAKLVVYA